MDADIEDLLRDLKEPTFGLEFFLHLNEAEGKRIALLPGPHNVQFITVDGLGRDPSDYNIALAYNHILAGKTSRHWGDDQETTKIYLPDTGTLYHFLRFPDEFGWRNIRFEFKHYGNPDPSSLTGKIFDDFLRGISKAPNARDVLYEGIEGMDAVALYADLWQEDEEYLVARVKLPGRTVDLHNRFFEGNHQGVPMPHTYRDRAFSMDPDVDVLAIHQTGVGENAIRIPEHLSSDDIIRLLDVMRSPTEWVGVGQFKVEAAGRSYPLLDPHVLSEP
ncbi:MAG: hypothetical protein IIC69_02385 [Nanoarchaeota archaeon]|nr:hypothetical protein [Nanoarchaeota archaeon]